MRVNPRPNAKYLKIKDADAEYGIPAARLWIWCVDKRLPHVKDGRAIYIKRADLDAFLDEQTVRS